MQRSPFAVADVGPGDFVALSIEPSTRVAGCFSIARGVVCAVDGDLVEVSVDFDPTWTALAAVMGRLCPTGPAAAADRAAVWSLPWRLDKESFASGSRSARLAVGLLIAGETIAEDEAPTAEASDNSPQLSTLALPSSAALGGSKEAVSASPAAGQPSSQSGGSGGASGFLGDIRKQRLLIAGEPPSFCSALSALQALAETPDSVCFPTVPTADQARLRLLPWAPGSAGPRMMDAEAGAAYASGEAFRSELASVQAAFEGLNKEQRVAVLQALDARDFSLIQGVPGAGKSSTIAVLVRMALLQGQRVMLTAYTHSAVDNVVAKLDGDLREAIGTDWCLRLGSSHSVHRDVQHLSLRLRLEAGEAMAAGSAEPPCSPAGVPLLPVRSAAALTSTLVRARVVATTCLGAASPVVGRSRFDLCVVDEASQLTEPVTLLPTRLCRRFCLVGDHLQLPPLVVSRAGSLGGMSRSLFARLAAESPRALTTLPQQYRMCSPVMDLANALVYEGRMLDGRGPMDAAAAAAGSGGDGSGGEGGWQAAAGRALIAAADVPAAVPPFRDEYQSVSPAPVDWLSRALHPHQAVLFLDTDQVGPPAPPVPPAAPSGGQSGGGGFVNRVEAAVVVTITKALLLAGVPAAEVGVIAPYRAQLKVLSTALRRAVGGELADEVEVATVDRYQGRDKGVVLISMVRSNGRADAGKLLADLRRINVAITRAKHKLLLVGSVQTMLAAGDGGEAGLEAGSTARLMRLLQANGQVCALPALAPKQYAAPLDDVWWAVHSNVPDHRVRPVPGHAGARSVGAKRDRQAAAALGSASPAKRHQG